MCFFIFFRTIAIYLYWSGGGDVVSSHNFGFFFFSTHSQTNKKEKTKQIAKRVNEQDERTHETEDEKKNRQPNKSKNSPNGHVVQYLQFVIELLFVQCISVWLTHTELNLSHDFHFTHNWYLCLQSVALFIIHMNNMCMGLCMRRRICTFNHLSLYSFMLFFFSTCKIYIYLLLALVHMYAIFFHKHLRYFHQANKKIFLSMTLKQKLILYPLTMDENID